MEGRVVVVIGLTEVTFELRPERYEGEAMMGTECISPIKTMRAKPLRWACAWIVCGAVQRSVCLEGVREGADEVWEVKWRGPPASPLVCVKNFPLS